MDQNQFFCVFINKNMSEMASKSYLIEVVALSQVDGPRNVDRLYINKLKSFKIKVIIK